MSFLDKYKTEIYILFEIIKPYVNEKFNGRLKAFDGLKKNSRERYLVYARKYMMVILHETLNKEHQEYTQQEIADTVGLDRTSLIHHFRAHKNDYTVTKGYKEEFDGMKKEFLERIKE